MSYKHRVSCPEVNVRTGQCRDTVVPDPSTIKRQKAGSIIGDGAWQGTCNPKGPNPDETPEVSPGLPTTFRTDQTNDRKSE